MFSERNLNFLFILIRNFRWLIYPYRFVAESDIVSFLIWSVTTGIIMCVTGLIYTVFTRKKKI